MKKSKQSSAVLCLGVLLSVNAAYAQWPVFDFQEIVPISKDVKTGVDTIKDLKEQIGEMNKTLNAIGKEAKTVASFSQNISANGSGNAKSAAEEVQTASSNSAAITSQTAETVSDTTTSTINTQKNIVNDYVDQASQIAGIGNNSQNMLNKNEEEEEEEEISIAGNIEELSRIQNEVQAEQKQLAVELNDILETQLTMLNKASAENIAAFEELDKILQNLPQLSPSDKNRLHSRIEEISQKQRENTDWAVRIVESAKENYNREYNKVIKDGINNYTKIVIAYTKGDDSKENVIAAGNKLKEETAAINVTPASSVLTELQNAVVEVNKDEKEGDSKKIYSQHSILQLHCCYTSGCGFYMADD